MKKLKKPWKSEEVFENIYPKVLNFISYKDRTSHELDKAIDKYLYKVPLTIADKEELKKQILEEVGFLGLVSDDSYVKNYVLDVIQTNRLISKKQISSFLYRKGAPSEIVSDYMERYYTQAVEEKIVSTLFDKKYRGASGFGARAKLVKYLLAKGFSSSVVYTVVDTKIKR